MEQEIQQTDDEHALFVVPRQHIILLDQYFLERVANRHKRLLFLLYFLAVRQIQAD